MTLSAKSRRKVFVPLDGDEGDPHRFLGEDGFKWTREVLARTWQTIETLREAEELHRLLFEKVPHPRFVCDARTLRILVVNEAAVRRYGYSQDELLRMKVTDLSTPESVQELIKYCRKLTSARFVADNRGAVFHHHKKDGRLIDVEVDATPIALRGRGLFLLLVQDVTERERVARRLRAQQATTHALAESSTLAEACPKIFHAICENLGCDWGELWRVDPVAQVIRCTQVWHPHGRSLPRMERAVRRVRVARGEGIAGLVWARNRTVWIADLSREHRFPRARVAISHDLRSVYAFPIRLRQEVLGVIAVFSREAVPLDKHLLHLLKDICAQIGQVMGRRRAEQQLLEVAEREQQRIGQDLHDGLCQQLTGIAYLASHLEGTLAKKCPRESVTASRIAELSRATAVQARQIARGLNPVELGTNGLTPALKALASSIGSMFSIACRFKCAHRVLVLDHDLAVHVYRIAQEAIHNSITHGKATEIEVSLRRKRGEMLLSVADNGHGISGISIDNWGVGLENMNYRARAIGADLELRAQSSHGGTIMVCTLPLNGRPT